MPQRQRCLSSAATMSARLGVALRSSKLDGDRFAKAVQHLVDLAELEVCAAEPTTPRGLAKASKLLRPL